MGMAKRLLEEQEDQEAWAVRFLCEAGVLKECENHDGTYFDGGADLEDAYRLFYSRVTSGQIVLEKGETRREYTDALKSAYDDNSYADGCPTCEKTSAVTTDRRCDSALRLDLVEELLQQRAERNAPEISKGRVSGQAMVEARRGRTRGQLGWARSSQVNITCLASGAAQRPCRILLGRTLAQ